MYDSSQYFLLTGSKSIILWRPEGERPSSTPLYNNKKLQMFIKVVHTWQTYSMNWSLVESLKAIVREISNFISNVYSRVSSQSQENSQNLNHVIQPTNQVLPYYGTLASEQQTEWIADIAQRLAFYSWPIAADHQLAVCCVTEQ